LSLYLEELSLKIISGILVGRQEAPAVSAPPAQPSHWSAAWRRATEADGDWSELPAGRFLLVGEAAMAAIRSLFTA
jgi:hypothetical protein